MTYPPKDKFIRVHQPCPNCGSSDALAHREDGSTYCFSCNKQTVVPRKVLSNLAFPSTVKVKQTKKLEIKGDIEEIPDRLITEETCKLFNYRIYGKEHYAPYYNEGQLVAIKVRNTETKEFYWLRRSRKEHISFFGQQKWSTKGKRIIITEGEIDALSCCQVMGNRWPVVSLANGISSAVKICQQEFLFLDGYDEILLAFDNDSAGKQPLAQISEMFTAGKVKIMAYPGDSKDSNDVLCQYGAARLLNCIYNAQSYRPDKLLTVVELRKEVQEYLEGPAITGYTLPFTEQLNAMSRGLRKGEIWTLCAGTKIGKSTVANEFIYHLITEHKLKIGVIALEEQPAFTALRYCSMKMNTPIHLHTDDSTVIKQAIEEFDDLFKKDQIFIYKHQNVQLSEELTSIIRFLANSACIDFLLFDHISMAVSGIVDGDERRLIDNAMTELRGIVEQSGMGCILISHLARKHHSELPYEEGGTVSLSHLRGSGAIAQISNTIIAFERNLLSRNLQTRRRIRIKVLGNRFSGETGFAGHVVYDPETGRLQEAIELEQINDEDNTF